MGQQFLLGSPRTLPFPNSGAFTVNSGSNTSGEDEEGLTFHRKAFATPIRTTAMGQKRPAESDTSDPLRSVWTEPATKRRAVMRAIYVDIPVLSANRDVSVATALTLTGFDLSLSLISRIRRIKARVGHLPL